MLDRQTHLANLVDIVLRPFEFEGPRAKLAGSWVINAADAATSPIRSCGGNCVDCRSLSRLAGVDDLRVCDVLEDCGEKVYREPDATAYSRTTGQMGGGAFY